MDPIQKRLALIDRQLAPPSDTLEKLTNTSPLLFCAVALIVGILLQYTLHLPLVFWLTILAISVSTAVFTLIIRNKFALLSTVFLCLSACFCFLSLGAIRLTSFSQPKPNDIRNLLGEKRQPATIRGHILTQPHVNKNKQWAFAKFAHNDPASSFYLKLDEIDTIKGWKRTTGNIYVRLDEPLLDLNAGDYIQACCWLNRFKNAANPGQFDIAEYTARKNVFITASIKSRDGIELLENKNASPLTKLKRTLKNSAARALLGAPAPQNQSEGLLQALLLGYRQNIDSATYRAFRKTGLLHFISLSGMHLGILIGIIWWLCKTAGLAKHWRAIICIISITVFLMTVPVRPPTLRAAIIGIVFCLSFLFRRKANSLNSLSLAAIILLMIKPTDLFEAGWQLSFAAVLGILLFCQRVHFFLYEKITGIGLFEKIPPSRPFYQIAVRGGPYLSGLFSTGLTAWLSGAGILLYHFYTVNPLTVIWTVIAFPFVAAILTIGFLKIILSFILPTAAILLGAMATALSDSLIWLVRFIAHPNFQQILIGRVSITLILFYYGLVLFTGLVYFQRPALKKIVCTITALCIIVLLAGTKWQRTHRSSLLFTCLDVGHGQAILAQLPGKANILFDAGSLHKTDIGNRIVSPFLDYNAIDKIDAIIISHNDIDHINGIPEIVNNCCIGRVYANDTFFEKADTWGTAKFLKENLRKKGLEIQTLKETLNINSSAEIKFLWPDKKITQNLELSDNDSSLVTLITFAERKILLCSDIENLAQQQILQLYPDLKADIVVAPHHGSIKTGDDEFINRLDAKFLLYSCGQSQYQKQLLSGTENAVQKFYTPKDGAITFRIDPAGRIITKTNVH